jgi:hypothetical protein
MDDSDRHTTAPARFTISRVSFSLHLRVVLVRREAIWKERWQAAEAAVARETLDACRAGDLVLLAGA